MSKTPGKLIYLFFNIRARHDSTTAQLSGMAQSVGYFIAGLGPILFGGIYDEMHNWSYSYCFLLLTTVGILIAGLFSAKDHTIEAGKV